MKKNNIFLKLSVTFGYLAMILVNYLANALPIGGVNTGEASDAYANLFTPAGATFSIWGLIYLLLLIYTIYQFGFKQEKDNLQKENLLANINQLFLITSLANIAWIFAWHYGIIWLSVLIMFVLLISLIYIAKIINKEKLSPLETLCIKAPFSIYFGWITVATIANITVFLVSINWQRFGLSEVIWTIIILFVGAGIGTLRTWKDKNIFYGSVFVWAYSGILFKHISHNGFSDIYPSIINTIIVCLIVFSSTIIFLSYQKISKKVENS